MEIEDLTTREWHRRSQHCDPEECPFCKRGESTYYVRFDDGDLALLHTSQMDKIVPQSESPHLVQK